VPIDRESETVINAQREQQASSTGAMEGVFSGLLVLWLELRVVDEVLVDLAWAVGSALSGKPFEQVWEEAERQPKKLMWVVRGLCQVRKMRILDGMELEDQNYDGQQLEGAEWASVEALELQVHEV